MTRAPVPTGAAANPRVTFGGTDIRDTLSCGATTCAAVGYYTDGAGNEHPALWARTGNTWTVTDVPTPAGSGTFFGSDYFASVACAATECAAPASSAGDSSGTIWM